MENNYTPIDLLDEERNLVRADHGKRLINYIVDLVFFYILMFVLGIVLSIIAPDFLENIANNADDLSLADRLLTLFLYGAYMGITEAIFKGKTLGKMITGTRAVNMDGTGISTQTALSRGLSKAVPFCAFSALGTPCNPWQDRWTNTMVIDEKKSEYGQA